MPSFLDEKLNETLEEQSLDTPSQTGGKKRRRKASRTSRRKGSRGSSRRRKGSRAGTRKRKGSRTRRRRR